MDAPVRRVEVVDDAERVAALTHPTRVAVLDALREPDSAAGVARRLGLGRQAVNYHVKALLEVGLVRAGEERRKGNFVEQLYQSVAGTFVVSPRMAWGDERRVDAMRRQLPLERLVELGEIVQRDAIELLDRATFDGDDVPCVSVDATVRFRDEAARTAFVEEYLAALKPLLKKYGARTGEAFRVAAAAYPITEGA